MERKWHSPADVWPTHSEPWWNDALDRARAEGWHLITYSGHSWGKVVCSRTAEGSHEKLIFSTGRAAENHARDLVKLIARCKHPRDDSGPVDYSKARRLLEGVQLLLAAADACVAAERKRAHIEELLRLCDDNLRDAEVTLARAIEAEEGLQDDVVQVYTRAARAGYPSDAPHTTEALVGDAEERLETARADVEKTFQSAERTALLQRAAELHARAAELRNLIDVRAGHTDES